MQISNSLSPQSNKFKRGDGNISNEDLECLPNLDEETIGIITLEDVLEELLQVNVLNTNNIFLLCSLTGSKTSTVASKLSYCIMQILKKCSQLRKILP